MPGKVRRTRGGTAVMANVAPKELSQDTPEMALQRTLDLFCTPPWAARAAMEHLAAMFPGARSICEPAAGKGHIAGPIGSMGFEVHASDIYDHGPGFETKDWLDDGAWNETEPQFDLIFTNPPFTVAHEFVSRGLRRARLGVALILRIAFLEGEERYELHRAGRLTQAVTYCERVPMVLGKWDPEISSATCYALFVWSKVHQPQPLAWFEPGTRDRLWLREDVERYAWREPLPLFPDAGPAADEIEEAI